MLELQPDKIFRGTWAEVVSHRDQIPSNAVVELKVYRWDLERNEEIGDCGGRTIGEVYGHFFNVVNFGPPDLAERTEEYLDQSGFSKAPNERDLNS